MTINYADLILSLHPNSKIGDVTVVRETVYDEKGEQELYTKYTHTCRVEKIELRTQD